MAERILSIPERTGHTGKKETDEEKEIIQNVMYTIKQREDNYGESKKEM